MTWSAPSRWATRQPTMFCSSLDEQAMKNAARSTLAERSVAGADPGVVQKAAILGDRGDEARGLERERCRWRPVDRSRVALGHAY